MVIGAPELLPFSEIAPDDAEGLIRAAIDRYRRKLTLACSFGGAGGMVLLDIAARIDPSIDVFVLDTDVLFEDTYRTIERVEARYRLSVRRVRSKLTLVEQAAQFGEALWSRDPDRCCELRKVEPMRRAVAGYDAWITAIRRDQAGTRAAVEPVSWDEQFDLLKLCPIARWDHARVMQYVKDHDVPLNPLLFEGYTSIGCTHCTRKPDPGDPRSGRWAGFNKVECGLHLRPRRPSNA